MKYDHVENQTVQFFFVHKGVATLFLLVVLVSFGFLSLEDWDSGMERVQFVLDRLSSRTFVSLSVLYALQHSALRRVFVRCVCAGAAATVFVLNFGLDLESARARRRALAAGVSRALCAAAAVHTVRSSHIKAKLFWTGVLLR